MPVEVPSLDILPLLPAFQPAAPSAEPKSRRGWLVAAIAVVVLGAIAGLAVSTGDSTSSAPSARSSQGPGTSYATEAAQYSAAVSALAAQGVPFAQQILSNETSASGAITSAEQQTNQIEQASEAQASANLSPTSPLQQCMNNAISTSTLGPQGDPAIAEIQQCENTYDNSAQESNSVGQIAQIGQTMIATATGDIQKADAAFRSLAGILTQETTLASDLNVPTAVAPDKQALLAALEAATAGATTGSAAGTIDQLSTASTNLSGDLGTVNAQTNSLVGSMKDS